MIALQRLKAGIPANFTGAGLAGQMTRLLTQFYDNAGKVPFNQDKTLQIWGDAKPNLRKESFDKCAYCEGVTATVAHGDVEHFRPKSSYWWLAYCYDNYAFACQICNQSFKGDKFPADAPQTAPPKKIPEARPTAAKLAALAAKLCPDPALSNKIKLKTLWGHEKAHLPHPYIDSPEALLAWEVDDINREVKLVALPGNPASLQAVLACENFLGLNRLTHRRFRHPQYKHIKAFAEVLQIAPNEDIRKIAKQALTDAASDDQPYAGMTRFFLRQWGVLV